MWIFPNCRNLVKSPSMRHKTRSLGWQQNKEHKASQESLKMLNCWLQGAQRLKPSPVCSSSAEHKQPLNSFWFADTQKWSCYALHAWLRQTTPHGLPATPAQTDGEASGALKLSRGSPRSTQQHAAQKNQTQSCDKRRLTAFVSLNSTSVCSYGKRIHPFFSI